MHQFRASELPPFPSPTNINNYRLFQPRTGLDPTPLTLPGVYQCSQLRRVLCSRLADQFALCVIVVFAVVVGLLLSLEDEERMGWAKGVEVAVLAGFLGEKLLKMCAEGMVTDRQIFPLQLYPDFDLIITLLGLTFASISLTESAQSIAWLPALHRITRLTIAFRKMGDATEIVTRLSASDNPAERVVKVLEMVKLEPGLATNDDMRHAVNWCIEAISGKLTEREGIRSVEGGNADGALSMQMRSYKADLSDAINVPLDGKLSRELNCCMNSVDSNNFDVFELKKVTKGNELITLMSCLFDRKRLFELVNVNEGKFRKLVWRVQQGYNNVPYHNATHAADVAQTLHYFLTTVGTGDLLRCIPLETAACYLAAAVHDFEHPGVNNTYLVNTQAELAIRYNDKSVLENHHIAAAFSLILEDECNFCCEMLPQNFARMRSLMIEMVLSTDIVQHFSLVSQFKTKFPSTKSIPADDKNLCFQLLLHSADISNHSKPWDICYRWAKLAMEECWNQGNQESQQGLPLSYLMDRYTTNTCRSQIGFIDVLVLPTFDALMAEFPKFSEACDVLRRNKEKWQGLQQGGN